jgi:hypothetical protein
MANVDDYTTEKILTITKLALRSLKFINIPIAGYLIRKKLLKRVKSFEPRLVDIVEVSELIRRSKKCAVGARVCRKLHRNSELTESVFLNGLAEGMVKSGKARYVTEKEAINTLKKYPGKPLIISRVSGRYAEICRSLPEVCVYWRMEKCGIACLDQ